MDLDQSGNFSQRISVFQGPTLGRVDVQVLPQIMVRSPGTTILGIGTSVVLVDVAGLVTINLPDVTQVIKVLPFLPGAVFAEVIWIKDLGGNARNFNIVVHPFPGQTIDKLAQDFNLIENRQLLRLYPMALDLSGWVSG